MCTRVEHYELVKVTQYLGEQLSTVWKEMSAWWMSIFIMRNPLRSIQMLGVNIALALLMPLIPPYILLPICMQHHVFSTHYV